MPRRLAIVAAPLLLAALLLSGCTPEPRIPAAEPQPTATPLFASDEEALAAATAAYEEYNLRSAEIASSPPFDLARLAELTSADFLEREREFFSQLADGGLRTEGTPVVESSQFQQRYEDENEREVVVIYVCVDVGETRVLDEAGTDRTPPDRKTNLGVEAEFVADSSGALILRRSEPWNNDSFCD